MPHTPKDMYESICKELDYSLVQFVLCPTRKDAKWTHGSVDYHSLAKEFMSALARVVLNFICNRLMPCQQNSCHSIPSTSVVCFIGGDPAQLRIYRARPNATRQDEL